MLNVETRSRECSDVRLPHFNSVGKDTGTVAYSTPMASLTLPIPTRQGQGHKKGGNAPSAASASNARGRRGRASERRCRSLRAESQPPGVRLWESGVSLQPGSD